MKNVKWFRKKKIIICVKDVGTSDIKISEINENDTGGINYMLQ